VAAYLDTWLHGKRDLRPTSRRSYVDALKPVHAALGGSQLQSVSKGDLDRLVEELLAHGGRRGGGWSPRTVTLTLTVLGQALDDAVREGLLARNVVRLVRRPRRSAPQPTTWTPEEVTRFLGEARRQRLYAAWLLGLMGLRRGEVLGLRWDDLDVDAAEPTLRVRATRVVVGGGGA
jgi:integrase